LAIERLQKILARGGFASRRAAEAIIAEGRVRVNGRVVTELGSKADPYKDKVEVNGVRVVAEPAVYVVLHKPRGVVTTMSDPEGRPSVREILAPIGTRVYPVGRLDFATSGVLLATNDGDFAEGMMHPKKAVPKTYVVKVAGQMQPKDLDRWRDGIRLEDGVTLPAKLKFLRHEGDKTWFELTIREGRNQQIRRMGEATGFPVMRLARLSFAGVTAEGLRPGEWRYLAPDELVDLKKDYGVPKRIVDAEMRPAGRTRPRKGPLKTPEPAIKAARQGSANQAARQGSANQAARQGEPGRGRGRGRMAPAAEGEAEPPRYGGGSPGRRGYDVAEDWGGGAGRGKTGSDRSEHAPRSGARRGSTSGTGSRGGEMPRGDLGGRGGASRTTGSGGGIGGRDGGDYRIKGRSGRAAPRSR
jgi:23S rRNA pseudouridine2605 synthase